VSVPASICARTLSNTRSAWLSMLSAGPSAAGAMLAGGASAVAVAAAAFAAGCGRRFFRCLGLRLRLGLADGRPSRHAHFAVALAGLLGRQLGQRGGGLGGIGERLGLALARGADAAPADVELGITCSTSQNLLAVPSISSKRRMEKTSSL
jgi:hypothetical protein